MTEPFPPTSPAQPVRRVEPRAVDWRSAAWRSGLFDTARRPETALVEGIIRTPQHLLLVTLRGGAERLEIATDCGHRFDGQERPGAVSFVPAHCERRLRMHGVRSEWASLSFSPSLFEAAVGVRCAINAFTNAEDAFLAALVEALWRQLGQDGAIEPLYGETMGLAAASYLARRFGRVAATGPLRIAPWQLRRVEALVEARCGEAIAVVDLAREVGLSVGHFHRAFRAATGQTPLAYVTAARLRRAIAIQAAEPMPIAALALRVGFASPSHFARLFRRATGAAPSRLQRG